MLRHSAPDIEMNSKCPSNEWIRASVRCLILPRESKLISMIDYIERSIPTTICAILPSAPKRASPLHCLTIRKNKSDGTPYIIIESIVWAVGCLLGIVTIYLIVNCKKFTRPPAFDENEIE